MNEPHVMEGTREEVGEQLKLFPKEQRFRLIALPQPVEQTDVEEPTLAERFAGRVGRFSFEPADLSERAEEYYGQLIKEKYAQESQGWLEMGRRLESYKRFGCVSPELKTAFASGGRVARSAPSGGIHSADQASVN